MRIIRHLLAAVLLVPTLLLEAQLNDHFADGDFKNNPVWQGDTARFIVNAAGELQLNAPEAGTSALTTAVTFPYATVWDFRTRLEFAPSNTNLLRIWLAISSTAPDAEGYLLDIGEVGSNDALRFFRRQNNTTTLLATGIAGEVAAEPVDARIVVQRTANGGWTAFLSKNGGPLVQQFSVNDATVPFSNLHLFGLNCIYTETRKDKFFFDDFIIKTDSSDVVPPTLVNYNVVDQQTITLHFNEPLDSASARILGNYLLNGGTFPNQVTWTASTPTQVTLQFGSPFANAQTYTLQANNIKDWLGNTASPQSISFSYIQIETAAPGDIIINEMMSAPNPAQGLPENAEWVEILNRSTKYIRLSELTFADATSTPKNLPDIVLAPDSVLVLCSANTAAALAPFTTKTAIISGFPLLNDDGDNLKISNIQGTLIDGVAYLDDWHTDPDKSDGGWSLERINPDLLCLGAENWQSCPSAIGGSPGKRNFAFSTAPDTSAPAPVKITIINTLTAQVTFSESMDVAALTDVANYLFSPAIAIAQTTLAPDDRSVVNLVFATPLQTKILYELRFNAGMTDCSGNSVAAERLLVFGIPENPEKGDILVNELLFNPNTGGARFVELYNNSDKIFDWAAFSLSNQQRNSTVDIATDRLFLPGDYYVFTPDRTDILANYPDARDGRVMTQVLPSLDDRSGNISLIWQQAAQRLVVDSFDYSTALHNPLLSSGDQKGVSIERIRFDAPTNNANNWTSAANNGTPTLPNSQASGVSPIQNDIITLQPARISPDGDGREDYLDIIWNLEQPGYTATITIYDSEGVPVKRILKQELAGTSGALRWDGDTDDGGRARPGIHILFMEIFNASGDVKRVKVPFAVIF
jgi:hypothetical protein